MRVSGLTQAGHSSRTEPRFRAILEHCDAQLHALSRKTAAFPLYPDPGVVSIDEGYARPALFGIAYAVAELWRLWGIVPALVVGHGLGEIAAATVAGMINLQEGFRLAACREDTFARQLLHVSFNAPAITLFSTRSLKP